jgi:hypothetical protein
LQDIAERLGEALNVVAVRQGRLSAKVGGKTAAGQYGTRSGVIRLKKADDYDVFAHELGHHVEAAMGKPLKQLMAQHASELTPMAYQGADPRMLVEEGFAEYMRMFATNPLYAAREAPAFDKAFRAYLAADAPDALKAIEEAAAAWRAWNEQPSADVVAATVVTGKEPGWFAKARADMARHGLAGTIAHLRNPLRHHSPDDTGRARAGADLQAQHRRQAAGAARFRQPGETDPHRAHGAWRGAP